MTPSDNAPRTRIVVAVVASTLVHVATLALPRGEGGTRWAVDAPRDTPMMVALEPAGAQPAIAVVAKVEQAVTLARPLAAAAPQRAVAPPRDAGPKGESFSFSNFRTAEGEAQQHALAELARTVPDLDVSAISSMASAEFVDVGFAEDWRGPLHALVAARVGADGNVEDVVVIDGDEALADYATRALRRAPFEPARHDGQPVKGYAIVSVDFCPARSVSCSSNATASR